MRLHACESAHLIKVSCVGAQAVLSPPCADVDIRPQTGRTWSAGMAKKQGLAFAALAVAHRG